MRSTVTCAALANHGCAASAGFTLRLMLEAKPSRRRSSSTSGRGLQSNTAWSVMKSGGNHTDVLERLQTLTFHVI